MHTIKFKTLNGSIDFAMMAMVDNPPENGGMDLDIKDYGVENGVWFISFSNKVDADKFLKLIDNKYLFNV